jgi:hypothetical protein
MTPSPNLNNLLTNLDLPKICTVCKTVYENLKKNFNKNKAAKDGYSTFCKKCKKIKDIAYASTEMGYLTNTYNTVKKKYKNGRYKGLSEKEKDPHRCYITKEEFFQLWEEHKKKFGYRCRLTGVKMVLQRAQDSKKRRFHGYSNAMSVDRLDPRVGYTKDNIIFISNEANKMKSAVTKQLCISILKLYEEKGL